MSALRPQENEWSAPEPPADFVDRVMDALDRDLARDEPRAKPPMVRPGRALRRVAAFGVALGTLAAAAALFVKMSNSTSGDVTADARREVAMGRRITAVLEPGAHVAWKGDLATQDHGDVFYRVDHGGPLVVHTPAGDVTVHGTCFRIQLGTEQETKMNTRDLKAAGIGAAITMLATVAVYEGKVSVSRAAQSRDLAAGQTAVVDRDGVHVGGSEKELDKAANGNSAAVDEPYAEANKNLADSVREYQAKLAAITADKADVEARLASAQQKLASAGEGGAPPKDDYDLGTDDWKELAKEGAIKYRIPCNDPGWTPSQANLDKLGLSPDDGKVLASAVKVSNDRTWSVIQPLCAQVLGANAEVASKLGPSVCMSMLQSSADQSKEADGIIRAVAEIRAGIRPAPSATDATPPLEQALLALTGESKMYEKDLAKSLGPEEAHRLANADTGCSSQNSYGAASAVMK